MSTMKHTPGPWHVANGCQIRSDKDQIAKAWMMRNGEGLANARLIAAAPELLEVCEKVSALYGRLWDVADQDGAGFLSPESVKAYDEAHRMIFAVIAKAKGES